MTDYTTELVEMMSRLCEFYSSFIQLNIILSLFNACFFFFTVENQGKSATTTNVGMEDVHVSVGALKKAFLKLSVTVAGPANKEIQFPIRNIEELQEFA